MRAISNANLCSFLESAMSGPFATTRLCGNVFPSDGLAQCIQDDPQWNLARKVLRIALRTNRLLEWQTMIYEAIELVRHASTSYEMPLFHRRYLYLSETLYQKNVSEVKCSNVSRRVRSIGDRALQLVANDYAHDS